MSAVGTVPAAESVRWGPDGLVPAVVIDAGDGTVLMLAWMDAAAYAATVSTGEVHFHSRSRGRLWRKGETSGHVLRLRSIALDCDADALLVRADPAGPTCHTGDRTCFDGGADAIGRPEGFAWLEALWTTIVERSVDRPAGSYTVGLLEAGVDGTARKVTEEATEVLIAAKDHAGAADTRTSAALAGESADLLFHLLVLLRERGLAPAEVIAVLRARHAR